MQLDDIRPAPAGARLKTNDFSLCVATANGTGSQTANLTLLRAFFKLGIPVNGKNVFPSNIQGLPTWYHIRVSHQGYVARRERPEVLVAFNPATLLEDLQSLPAGGVCVLNGDLAGAPEREDVTTYALPVGELVAAGGAKGKLRDYLANMVYVGALAHLLGIPLGVIEEALSHSFGGRRKLVEANLAVVSAAHTWAGAHLTKADPFAVAPMSETDGLVLITGNEAGALGAVFGGVSVAAWYPITPSTSFFDALREFLPKLRPSEDGVSYAVVQAEDELAAAGMVLGAGWAGARALTATSGPGLSLMSEFAGLGYFAEIPAVIWDVQRVGPSTGMPTRTGQGDVTFAYYLGHGDTKNVILFPGSAEECFEFGYRAFDIAETLQTPVFVLSDLDLGMNNWMATPFAYPEGPMARGKVLSASEVAARGFARYRDVDGDGVPYRTLPGNEHPRSAYFTRGTGHNEAAEYSERAEDWARNMERLRRKFETARALVPEPELDEVAGARVAIVAFGTTQYAIREARDLLAAKGVPVSFMRLRALPVGEEVGGFIGRYERLYVVELNRDGQLHAILRSEVPEGAAKLVSVAHLDGLPLTTDWLVERLQAERLSERPQREENGDESGG